MNAKPSLLILALASVSLAVSPLFAGTPEQEKAFVQKYKVAFEAGDKATLEGFLYTKGADPTALEFYKMMQLDGAGGKITSIELLPLTPEDVTRVEKVQDGPGGKKFKIPLKPVKKLKITVEQKGASGSSTSSTETYIAEADGKFVIPVPAVAK